MRTHLVLAILGLAAPASADALDLRVLADHVIDLGGAASKIDIEAALGSAPVMKAAQRCAGTAPLLGFVVFQNGKVAQLEVAGSTERAFEKCVTGALRTATIATKSRVVATFRIRRGDPSDELVVERTDNSKPVKTDDGTGWLTRDEIGNTVKRSVSTIRGCYEKELLKAPALGGKVVVRFQIAADGTVATASTASSTLESAPAVACILAAVKKLTFPAKAGPTNVNYPFIFSPGN